jgi:hypothetical protein
VIQCNGIAKKFSTGTNRILDESDNHIYIWQIFFDDTNPLFLGPKVEGSEADRRLDGSSAGLKKKGRAGREPALRLK